MNNVKKGIISFGAVAVVLIMMSSVIAVPNVESGSVMASLEKERTETISELENIYNEILEDESLGIAELQEYCNIDPYQDFEDLFDTDGFLNYIISDDFIDALKDKFDDLLSDEAVLFLFNSDEMQEYVNSDEFMYFVNTDELQYVLDKLDEPDDQQAGYAVLTGETGAVVQCIEMGVQQNYPLVLENYLETDLVFCTAEDEELEIETSLDFPLLEAFIVLLVAVILWIPAVIVIILFSPLIFLYEFAQYYGYYFYGVPGGIIASAVIALLLTLTIVVVLCGFWPLLAVWSYFNPVPL